MNSSENLVKQINKLLYDVKRLRLKLVMFATGSWIILDSNFKYFKATKREIKLRCITEKSSKFYEFCFEKSCPSFLWKKSQRGKIEKNNFYRF